MHRGDWYRDRRVQRTLGVLAFALILCLGGTLAWAQFWGGNATAPSLIGTTGSIGGGALLAGGCASGTVAVTGATTAMSVSATPQTYPGDGTVWFGYVSSPGTVTVKACAIIALTPAASLYSVRVVQ